MNLAENLNNNALYLEEKAKQIRTLVAELGEDWASEGYDESAIVGRFAALLALHEEASRLMDRANQKRREAFLETTKDSTDAVS